MSKLILRIDASALKESSCLRRFYWNVVSGYRSPLQTNDVEFGSAFHEFVKVAKLTGDMSVGLAAALKRFNVPMIVKDKKEYLTPNYLLGVCQMFWNTWLREDQYTTLVHEGKPLVELGFSYPYYADDEVEVLLCGTIDDICQHKHGTYALRDYKTTSVYKKDLYLAGYELNAQLMFYRLVLRYYSRSYPDSILAQIAKTNVECFIEAIFLQGAAKAAEVKRSKAFMFTDATLDEFEILVRTKIMSLVAEVKRLRDSDKYPAREGMTNGACETVYGHCKFFSPCVQLNDTATWHTLSSQFIQRSYNPLLFGKEHNEIKT